MILFAIGLVLGLVLGGAIVGYYDVRVSRRQLLAIKNACREHREKQQHELDNLMLEVEKMQKKVGRYL